MDEHLRNILKFNQSKVQYGAFEGLILPFLKNRSLVTLVGFRFHPCLPLAILGCHLSRCLSQTTQWQCRQHISRIILRGFRSPSEPVVSWQTFPFWTVFQGLQNRIIYSMDPKNFHPPSATLSCAPCEMGLQHVLHCTHPRSTMNCCPHQESPRNMAMAQGLKHLATNGSTEFVVFPMFLCTICMTPFNSIVANHINIVTQPFKIFGKMEVTIL